MSSQTDLTHQAPGATGVTPTHPAGHGYQLEIVDADAGVVRSVGAPRQKIAIVGFAASTRNLAPFDDPAYEIWGLNQLYRHIPRETRHFDIHRNWREENVDGTDHPRWLAESGIPVYMIDREPSIPTSVRYPIERVIERVIGLDYETSTVAFMVALAIMEIDDQVEAELAGLDFETLPMDPGKFRRLVSETYLRREIAIFGIDLVVGTEWEHQKACVEYLLGMAHARGIMLRIPPQSALLKQQWRYGYETQAKAWPIGLTELQKRQGALANQRNTLIAQLQMLDGALQENSYWSQIADLRLKGAHVKLNEDT